MNSTNTLKEYYIKIFDLYNNCVNMLTSLNQSLSTASPQVSLNIIDSDGISHETKIPSFIYLDNKLDEIKNSFNNFFDIPNSGDAWFENDSNMYKFHLIKSNTAPQIPNIINDKLVASFTDNNYFKDLVSPKMYLKMNISNLTNNIEKIFVKKYIFYNTASNNLYEIIQNSGIKTNEQYAALLSSYTKGKDYDVYDLILDLPLKKEIYNSQFQIEEIVKLDGDNPYVEYNTDLNKEVLNYKLILNTIEYNNQEDNSIKFLLKAGDSLSLNNTNSEYYVKYVNNTTNEVIIEERLGHSALQPFNENPNMFFTINNHNYDDYNYIQIPLEENQYIAVFIGTIYNNVRSILSNGVLLDLNNIYMIDEYGNKLVDSKGNQITYMKYYNTYCKNIGDILSGFSEITNPLLSEYEYNTLEDLQTSESIKELVDKSFNSTDILQVVPINKHLIDDSTTQEIINLHNQKSELNNKLTSINSNIDDLYNTLTNTDWSQEVANSQLSIRKKLDEYYNERTQITTQLSNVVDSINAKSVVKYDEDLKYRIRGILDTNQLEEYVSSNYQNVVIIGIDVQYKYKSNYSTTTAMQSINANTFTDWNRYTTKDKERYVDFNEYTSSIELKWLNENSTDNIIKWNQIDIPINQNEEVVFKIRYKYNIGQPFVTLYTPWSNEETFVFPDEYKEMVQISEIIEENASDTNTSNFNKTLINDGYAEHVNNKFISGNQVFYHMPESIYSGFNTSENNLLSLKDKLTEMSNDIEKYRDILDESIKKKYSVYLEFDNQVIELFSGSINRVNINDTNITDSFIKKPMRIIIKNTGENPVKFYTMFPGNSNVTLIEDNRKSYVRTIGEYERVPILINDQMTPQFLGQWIYFRQNNPFTKEDIYLNENSQNIQDKSNINDILIWGKNNSDYKAKDNSQILYPYKEHGGFNINLNKNIWQGLKYTPSADGSEYTITEYTLSNLLDSEEIDYSNKTLNNFYHYDNVKDGSNIYLMRFEDIKYVTNNKIIYLSENDVISDFMNAGYDYLDNSIQDFNGAFLYPDIMHKNNIIIDNTDINPNNYMSIDIGKDMTIPLTFEYCLNNTTGDNSKPISTIKKSIYFDLKDSLFVDAKNYMIELTVNNNYSSLNNYLDITNLLQPEGTE